MAKCIDCGTELKDFSIYPKTLNPDEQEFSDTQQDLFFILNGKRRFYCYKCDLGFDEDEVK